MSPFVIFCSVCCLCFIVWAFTFLCDLDLGGALYCAAVAAVFGYISYQEHHTPTEPTSCEVKTEIRTRVGRAE